MADRSLTSTFYLFPRAYVPRLRKPSDGASALCRRVPSAHGTPGGRRRKENGDSPPVRHPAGAPAHPLGAEEHARAEANFVPLVAERLTVNGRFRASADTPETVKPIQGVSQGG